MIPGIHINHQKNIGNSNENTLWKDRELIDYWYTQGRKHTSPSPQTNDWINKFTTMILLISVCMIAFIIMGSLQIHQSNKILSAVSDQTEKIVTALSEQSISITYEE